MDDLISRQMLLEYIHGEPVGRLLCDKYNLDGLIKQFPSAQPEPCEDAGEKTCRTCHLWEDGEINIACPWGSNYEHYEDDYCSLWEKQN